MNLTEVCSKVSGTFVWIQVHEDQRPKLSHSHGFQSEVFGSEVFYSLQPEGLVQSAVKSVGPAVVRTLEPLERSLPGEGSELGRVMSADVVISSQGSFLK